MQRQQKQIMARFQRLQAALRSADFFCSRQEDEQIPGLVGIFQRGFHRAGHRFRQFRPAWRGRSRREMFDLNRKQSPFAANDGAIAQKMGDRFGARALPT